MRHHRAARTRATDVVVLVPGFMGFGRLGSLYYFADRASAAVRGALETRLGRAVPVVCARTDPAGSLGSRQRVLLSELRRIDQALGGVAAFHLVGHSTGGVDAELLTCKHSLAGAGRRGRGADPEPGEWEEHGAVRARIVSVTTISAPHYGTSLVDSPAAAWMARPKSVRGFIETAELVGSLAKLLATRSLAVDGAWAAAVAAPDSAAFVWRFLTHRKLLDDLKPERMVRLRAENPPDPEVPASIRCVVSTTPPAPDPDGLRACDGFFARLHALTAAYAAGRSPEETSACVDALTHWRGAVIAHADVTLPSFTPATNDGVVNSARQLLATHATGKDPSGALAAIVVGDHGDVIGHYDRQDSLTSGRVLNKGFFRSGSGFGDDEFFGLWDVVAREIAEAIEHRRASRQRPRASSLGGRS